MTLNPVYLNLVNYKVEIIIRFGNAWAGTVIIKYVFKESKIGDKPPQWRYEETTYDFIDGCFCLEKYKGDG